MEKNRPDGIQHSALWAAYGDALGFITELTDEAGVLRRSKKRFVDVTVPWRRMLGGKFGGQVLLPSGCYSDDTQLRLATGRAIRGDGTFDVGAFAKVELPVFDAYALGGGLSTKAAAHALSNASVNWFSNFYEKGRTRYVDAGGNGVAMRIQPHVWCDAHVGLSSSSVGQIIRNCVATHGHPKALAGALFHAFHLSLAVWSREIMAPELWRPALAELKSVPQILKSDSELGMVWLPTWQERFKRPWNEVWAQTLSEFTALAVAAAEATKGSGDVANRYAQLIQRFDATSDAVRGEAMRTVLLAQFLSWEFRNDGPESAIRLAANTLHTDTDTIATLAGAILGALAPEPPSGDLLDRGYIKGEATRMSAIASHEKATSFSYPNLLTWKPPKSQLDVVGVRDNKLVVAGLGVVKEAGDIFHGRRQEEIWQILNMQFGQTLVAKRRSDVRPSGTEQVELFQPSAQSQQKQAESTGSVPNVELSNIHSSPQVSPANPAATNLDEITSNLIGAGFQPEEIGRALLQFADFEDGIERAVAFAAILVKARRARIRKGR